MRPTLRGVLVFLAGVPLSLAAVAVSARLWTIWLTLLAATVLITAADVLLALPKRRVRVEATTPEQVFIGVGGAASLAIAAAGWRRAVALDIVVELDDQLEPLPPASLVLRSDGAKRSSARAEHPIALTPRRRGDLAVRAAHLRWTGPLGLIERHAVIAIDKKVGVVPDLGAVRAVALRMFADRDFMTGLKVERYLGDGSEFESLHEYVPGLDHRAIDWKSSARHRRLLCQEFRAERNHQVVLALDGGQLMSEPLGGVPKLDHAVNAAMLLGWFCLRTGDRVGMLGFDERVRLWADPAGGMHAFPRIQALSAEVDYRHVETNYTLALAELSTRLRRRSLVVLFTDFLDTVTAELMIDNVTRLARRHLVLFVAVKDPSLDTRALARPRSLDTLHQAVVAGDFAREREVVLERLRRRGVHCLDVAPKAFNMALINRYLEIKRRELV
jgi:uncharacterized protein (DUF58 family)